MSDLGYKPCRRCRHYWASVGELCGNCVATHIEWAPHLGCGDVGCTRYHPSSPIPPQGDGQ